MQRREDGATGAEAADGTALPRVLGLWQLSLSGIGIILGAGIYALLSPAAALAGNAVWVSFLVAAAVALASGLSYAELAAMYPTAGAEYDYAARALGERTGIAIGWLVLAATIVSASAVALGFAAYLRTLVAVPEVPAAIALIGALALLLLYGVRESAGVAVVLTLIEVGGLVAVILVGLPRVGGVDLLELSPAGPEGVLQAAALVFFAFIGFEQIAKLAEEAKDPGRTVPLALMIAVAVSTALYALVAVGTVALLGWEGVSATEAPFAAAIGAVFGPGAAAAISFTALTATANTVLIELLAASRIGYGMARSGAAPRILTRIEPRRRTPWVAVVVVAALAAAFTLPGEIAFLANATNFLIFVTFIAVNASVVLLRRSVPDQPRPFRVPLSVRGTPVLPLLGIAASFGLLLQLESAVVLTGVAVTAAAAVAALAVGRRRPTAA
jgi:basic amino acid/polyamine antiporter, APA family